MLQNANSDVGIYNWNVAKAGVGLIEWSNCCHADNKWKILDLKAIVLCANETVALKKKQSLISRISTNRMKIRHQIWDQVYNF